MVLVIFFLIMVVVVAVVFSPFFFGKSRLFSRDRYEIVVLADMLEEIAADEKRGIISKSEADAARLEVSRKLLRAQKVLDDLEKSQKQAVKKTAKNKRKSISTASAYPFYLPFLSAFLMMVLSFGVYLKLGNYEYEDVPYLKRFPQSERVKQVHDLVKEVEARLHEAPDDVNGWKVLAPAYMKIHRYQDALSAYANVLRLQEPSLDILNNFGEALFYVNRGQVNDQALRIFERANHMDDKDIMSLYYLGLGKRQRNQFGQAIDYWQKLVDVAPEETNQEWLEKMKIKIEKVKVMMKEAHLKKNPDENMSKDTEQREQEGR